MLAPLTVAVDTSAIENLLAASLAQHRQEMFEPLARLTSLMEGLLSDTQDLRARFEAALTRISEEVRETRTAADSMLAAMRGLREQYGVVVDELRRRGLSEADLAPLAELAATLDTMQAEFASAAAENIEGGGAAPAANDGRVGGQRAGYAAAGRAPGPGEAAQPMTAEDRARREEEMRLEREAGLRPSPAPQQQPQQGQPAQRPADQQAQGGQADAQGAQPQQVQAAGFVEPQDGDAQAQGQPQDQGAAQPADQQQPAQPQDQQAQGGEQPADGVQPQLSPDAPTPQ